MGYSFDDSSRPQLEEWVVQNLLHRWNQANYDNKDTLDYLTPDNLFVKHNLINVTTDS
jgi:hypothetical protein